MSFLNIASGLMAVSASMSNREVLPKGPSQLTWPFMGREPHLPVEGENRRRGRDSEWGRSERRRKPK